MLEANFLRTPHMCFSMTVDLPNIYFLVPVHGAGSCLGINECHWLINSSQVDMMYWRLAWQQATVSCVKPISHLGVTGEHCPLLINDWSGSGCIVVHRWNYECTGKCCMSILTHLPPGQNGRHFPDVISKCIFMNEKFWILIPTLKFVPKGPINNNPALVQIMAWRRSGDKPWSEPMLTQFADAYMRH